jgi:hypothetical protein
VLAKKPACDAKMVTLLDCLASATCSAKSKDICKVEQAAFKDCGEHDSEPPSGTDMGGPSGDTDSVSCRITSADIAPSGQSGCQTDWDDCSDGKSYSVKCNDGGTGVICSCAVSGSDVEVAFSADSCPMDKATVNERCGWHLQ